MGLVTLSSPTHIPKKRPSVRTTSFVVREMGLEPTRHNHTHLKRACLPFQHSREQLEYYIPTAAFCQPVFPCLFIFSGVFPCKNTVLSRKGSNPWPQTGALAVERFWEILSEASLSLAAHVFPSCHSRGCRSEMDCSRHTLPVHQTE